jgi:hypothetical protein
MTNDEWIAAMTANVPDEGEFEIGSYDALHPGRFLKHGHLQGEPRTLTVSRYAGERMGEKNGMPDIRGIMTFSEISQQYVTQKTNEALLRTMFGPSPAALIGKRITFRPGKTKKGRDMVDCIRVAGSPDIDRDMETTVVYAEKSMRKPESFSLTRTIVAATLPRGDIAASLAEILAWDGDSGALRERLSAWSWTDDERQQIRNALMRP